MTVSTAATFTPVQSHTLVRHQLHCPSGQRVAPHQLYIQQSSTAHRQVQPIALRVTPQDRSPPPLALQTRTTPTTATVQSQHTEFLSVPSSSNQLTNQSAVVSMSTAPPAVLPSPPPLHLGPVLEPVSQYSPLSSPPPLTMALPRLVQPQRLSLRSVQTVTVRSDQMQVSEEELPVTEEVVQLPFPNLPPPQTVAVDLKVQPATQKEAPSVSLIQSNSILSFTHNNLLTKDKNKCWWDLRSLHTESEISVFFIFAILSYQNSCYRCENTENWTWCKCFYDRRKFQR